MVPVVAQEDGTAAHGGTHEEATVALSGGEVLLALLLGIVEMQLAVGGRHILDAAPTTS
jgi:hypothetical protein